ncbi:MAG: 50S ribosomal protein L32e [Candidatus Odinarchaeota archaeon]|nr:50S ribosomal protein L32e [Candidatus Odinarchaeota archaeon]
MEFIFTRKEVNELSEKAKINRLLKLRKLMNKKRPKFIRQESWRYKRVHPEWRRPRGIDSKMAEKRKGWPKMPQIGYGSPKLVRHYHPSGRPEVLIHNVKELESLDPEKVVLRIAHTVGERKRLDIIERASELGFKIVNAAPIEETAGTTISEEVEEGEEISEEETKEGSE